MKKSVSAQIEIPEGITCELVGRAIKCKKDGMELSKEINSPGLSVSFDSNTMNLEFQSVNKNGLKVINSLRAHIKNMFDGLNKKHEYMLKACNVHFPMTLKVDGKRLVINNFLGEKTPRYAKILPSVEVKVSGQDITVSSHDKDLAGQTAANIEKATKIRFKDRRVFQDGIFITNKPGEKHG